MQDMRKRKGLKISCSPEKKLRNNTKRKLDGPASIRIYEQSRFRITTHRSSAQGNDDMSPHCGVHSQKRESCSKPCSLAVISGPTLIFNLLQLDNNKSAASYQQDWCTLIVKTFRQQA